jgi:hypothetical protein
MNLEIKFRFFSGFEFNGVRLLRAFVFTNANSLVHKFGQGVPQDSPQTLFFILYDMHRPTPKIKEVMEFQKGLSIDQSLKISEVWRIGYRSALFQPSKQILRYMDNFLDLCNGRTDHKDEMMFRDQSQIRLYKIFKSLEKRHHDQRQQWFEIFIFSF